ncbi:hypothetical protein AB1L42_11145, partial [Thalassoglobus sp. JC818]|uniref:hypothetical protein n=1 Tax=Thalassoglobus sp. JC818 TaxID=3232136 RepID=UPI00345959D7
SLHRWLVLAFNDKRFLFNEELVQHEYEIDSILADGKQILTTSLNLTSIQANLAIGVLNEDTLLLTTGGVNGLLKEFGLYDAGKRLEDHERIFSAYQLLNPDNQMVVLLDIDSLALWLMDIRLDTGFFYVSFLTSGISHYMYFIELFRNAPPIAVGTRFDKQFLKTEVAVSHKLLPFFGQLVRTILPSLADKEE